MMPASGTALLLRESGQNRQSVVSSAQKMVGPNEARWRMAVLPHWNGSVPCRSVPLDKPIVTEVGLTCTEEVEMGGMMIRGGRILPQIWRSNGHALKVGLGSSLVGVGIEFGTDYLQCMEVRGIECGYGVHKTNDSFGWDVRQYISESRFR